MSLRTKPSGLALVRILPWRQITQRYSFYLFIILAASFLVIGKIKPTAVENVRSHTLDGIAPVLEAFASPVTAMQKVTGSVSSYLSLRQENEKLRNDLAQMKEWQNAVLTLQDENNQLHGLLKFHTEPNLAYISARVIADTGGPFVRSMILTAGQADGAKEGMAVLSGDGLIGRVVEVGSWSSRVLLITDLNSRIPVTILGSDDRAIVAGDNSPIPKLLYLPLDNMAKVSSIIVTSGHGGVFPPNLPVGHVIEVAKGVLGVVPTSDLSRINYVRLVDFSLKGGAFNPAASLFDREKAKR